MQNERKNMNNKFDELTKSLAQSVTRRAALKKFGVGLVAAAAATLGITRASAGSNGKGNCAVSGFPGQKPSYTGWCVDRHQCLVYPSSACSGSAHGVKIVAEPCSN